jgi:hypothetical protein
MYCSVPAICPSAVSAFVSDLISETSEQIPFSGADKTSGEVSLMLSGYRITICTGALGIQADRISTEAVPAGTDSGTTKFT